MNEISAAEGSEPAALTAGGDPSLIVARQPHGGHNGSNLAGIGPMGGPAQ